MNEQSGWERELLEKLANSSLTEQRKSRHWKIFFRLIWILLAVWIISLFAYEHNSDLDSEQYSTTAHSSVVYLNGAIDSRHKTSQYMIESMKKAYQDKNTKAIIISANSPGGSPVLSAQAFDEIRYLKKQHPNIPIYTVVGEVCASGCYYIASASDKIFVNPASIVGSVGVLMNSFGFVGAMQKLGIERRLYTAGSNKGMGDPFSPSNPKQEQIIKTMLEKIHQQFIAAVKLGRGARLQANNPELFSGRIYLGSDSVKLGLSDGFGSVESVARDIVKVPQLKAFKPKESFIQRLERGLGASVSDGLRSAFETRLM